MHSPLSMSRATLTGMLLVGLVATSGCSWFRKGNDLYAQSPESRPLEVPPDLDMPRTEAAMGMPAGPVTASGQRTAAPAPADSTGPSVPTQGAAGTGFTTTGTRDAVFEQVGEALMAIDGVEIASRAQLLGVFDVNYEASNFLIRVSQAEAGAYVSAVDPRGLPATGDASVKLIEALKAAIGGN